MIPALLPEDEDSRVEALLRFDILDTGADADLDEITRFASELVGAPIGLISLVDEDRQWFKSRVGLDATETPRDLAFCAHAILDDVVFEVPDATLDERFFDNPLVTGGPKVRFYAGAPLQRKEGGSALGTLCVIDDKPRELSDEQRRTLEFLAGQVMHKFEERLLLRDLARATRRSLALERYLKTYTPRAVWHQLIDAVDQDLGEPGGVLRVASYAFFDVCEFTALSSRADPDVVTRALNWYVQPIVDAVEARGGDVEKFIGDGVFAVFDQATDAVLAAVEAQAGCRRAAEEAPEVGLPVLQVRAGVHAGPAVRTHVGTASRRDNTLIGEAVNTAARLEAACPPGAVLVSDAALAMVSIPVAVRQSYDVSLKGLLDLVRVHLIDA